MEVTYYSYLADRIMTVHCVKNIAQVNIGGIVRLALIFDDGDVINIDPLDLISIEREDF